MKICDPSLLTDYLNDRLSPQKETAVEAHLTTCDTCRDQMAEVAASGDDWIQITCALRIDEYDALQVDESNQPAWPLKLLGPTDDPRMLGRIGPFEVSGCVGVGGMGVVFKARDPALDRYVAVKVLAPHLAASDNARARFAREAKAAAAVVHDHVIAVHQVSEYQGLPYLVMPYLPGPSLEDRLQRQGRLAPLDALRIARQVAAGLAAAHEQGLIHRDIKPANIMLSGETERAIITDFGLARAADDATLTQSGTLAGTPQFMAPEQARGDYTDARSDLFSLGSVLFTMLTGEPPFPLLSGSETIRRVAQEIPPKVDSMLADVPSEITHVLQRLHAFDSRHRISSAKEIQNLLEAAMPNAGSQQLALLPEIHNRKRTVFTSRRLVIAGGLVTAIFLATFITRHLGTFQPRTSLPVEMQKNAMASQKSSGATTFQTDKPTVSDSADDESTVASASAEVVGTDAVAQHDRGSVRSSEDAKKARQTPVPVSIPADEERIQLDNLFQDIETRLDQLEHR